VIGTALFGGLLLDLSLRTTDDNGVAVVGVVDSVDPAARYKSDQMTYHYTVDGTTYHGSTTGRSVGMVGRKIELRYDPDDPSDSWRPQPRDTPPSWHPGPSDLTILVVAAVLGVLVWFMVRPPWRRRAS
jgi:uncharacterized protein DUF3592